ncbi:MAG: hypothetical protein J2P15_21735, partial [Micromonosporaceae bacterium]|nr:hypothetical protein [Micromonosporaceae bacterium]
MTETGTGLPVPELRRLRYFHGQLLGARDFQREQAYLREKIALQLRYLLGYGVVCGLEVAPDDEKHPDPAQQPAAGSDQAPPRRARVELSPGLGVDACG